MEKEVEYLTAGKIAEYNVLILTVAKAKKSDKPQVLSQTKLDAIVLGCQNQEGDIYDKATFLFKNIISQHPFASGNRRTAFLAAKQFLLKNNGKFKIEDHPLSAKRMVGIREGYYTFEEIKGWIQHGKIKEFERFK